MNISTHDVPETNLTDARWADALVTGNPLGVLVGAPLTGGAGLMIAGWPDGGPGPLELIASLPGRGSGAASYMQVVAFDGPRSAAWVAAEELAAARRLWPAVRDIPGIVRVLRLRAEDNGLTVVTLTETPEAIDAAVQAIMSTELLPEEDPAMLSQPDRVGVYRLVHADLPLEATIGMPVAGNRT